MYNSLGVLVLPAQSVLTRKEIEMLLQQNIVLNEDDVEPESIRQLVNSSIKEIRIVFEKVRNTDQIPFEHLRERIVPIVTEMCSHPNLKHILSHLELHDEYTYRHSIGVALISRVIGKSKGLPAPELAELTSAAFLHDIGKVRVPDNIINKPGKLSPEEFTQVKNHTVFGYELIASTSGISHRHALVALQHHEREDGSGYPYGLKGNSIDPFSKIVAVADVFHAMISKRAYKNPVPFYKVLQEMSEFAYGSLEPSTTLIFVKRIMEMLVGNSVVLSNGHEGKIIMVSPNDPVHPLVEVNGSYIDLSKDQSVFLERIV
ncbi:HD-GYP domain-containing protein [Paenibacillus koleovorans]|uniref:HD-GYP domain-containing protein n=1 Tax=Paenibacillus koleovorans TaxID=121608 RepID=UPI000FDBE956|nr:HD-GYP domain-containing protein [Paenibacillus koleovorans]